MDTIWFSPLMPAALFLVGALLMTTLLEVLSDRMKSAISLILSLVALLVLLSRIVFGQIALSEEAPLVFSGWGVAGALTLRVDGLSMAFLFIPVLLLIALFWARQARTHTMLLALAGAALPVFVAANGISFSYALLAFDFIGCLFWLYNRRSNLAFIRLFLAILTTSMLMLAGMSGTAAMGGNLLAFVLWLRVGLIPFVEMSYLTKTQFQYGEIMIWFALSTAVGVYVARFLTVPLPQIVMLLMVLIMLLNAWLAWLEDPEHIRLKLLRMILIQPSLALLIAPISARVSIILGLVYTFALGALWLMPRIGRPNFLERHWLWIYTAPLLATLSLMGFPATFGFMASDLIYSDLLLADQLGVVTAVVVAEGISFSVIYHYWQQLLSGNDKDGVALRASLVLSVPFLMPWVAGITFSVVTGLDLNSANTQTPVSPISGSVPNTWYVVVATWLLAIAFGQARSRILNWLKIRPVDIEPILNLTWFWPYTRLGAIHASGLILRAKSILEGAHYLGWAFLIALAGILVVILT